MFTNLLSIPVPIFKRPLLTTMMATLVATASLRLYCYFLTLAILKLQRLEHNETADTVSNTTQ